MKRMMVAGNWKMFSTVNSATQLIEGIVGGLPSPVTERNGDSQTDVVICPPYTVLGTAAHLLANSPIALGGQNCHHEQEGAFTGEVSAQMLTDIGCSYVILGHSERRRDYHESNSLIALKALAAVTAGLTPIVCVGESLEQRERGETADVVGTQLTEFVHGAGSGCLAASIIAYEPVWAIGTGKAATPEQAQEVHADIRRRCEEQYGLSPMILYGGSVNANNAQSLFQQVDIDGALVGGASLSVESFLAIIKAAVGS